MIIRAPCHIQVYPTTNLVYTPPTAIWCACRILLQVHQQTTHFSPFLGTLPTPGGGMIWASPLAVPPSPPKCTSPTSPTSPSIGQLICNGTLVPHAPPPFISSEPPVRTEPLPDPSHQVIGSPDPAPDRVGPSQPPLNFVDGNGYIVLRGLVEARDCEVGWNKVMKEWGSGDEQVVAKNFELLFNDARSEEQAKDPALHRRWQSKSTLGSEVGGPRSKKFHPHLTETVPGVGDLHPMTPASVSVPSVGSGLQLPRTDVTTHPEVLPPPRQGGGGLPPE